MALIMVFCAGILVCAMTPSLTAMLAEKVEDMTAGGAGENGNPAEQLPEGDLAGEENPVQADPVSGEGDSNWDTGEEQEQPSGDASEAGHGDVRPGINTDWIGDGNQTGYEPPDSETIETPDTVSGRTGYEPVQEEAEQILSEEGEDLEESAGNTGSDISFDPEFYPYYAMLETDMRALYNQIYANAMDMVERFAPVADVNVNQLKTVFEAVYNDHPELFWLETGYSCKYLRSGKCVEITLKYNGAAENPEQAGEAFENRAGEILSEAETLSSAAEKERYVHDRLMESVEYSLGASMNQSAYSALVEGSSVCAGYARAFQYLMQQLGIPCYYCTGFAGEDHAWNIVKLEDSYYNVDVTWDDTETPTYDYFNKSDREFGPTHIRTGLSVYLPACQQEENAAGSGEAVPSADPEAGEADQTEDPGQGLINPNPSEPLVWQSRTPETDLTPEEQRQENLERAGISETDIRDTLQEYYEDCQKLLKEVGKGDQQFTNVIPESLWSSVERAYSNGEYWKGYVEGALESLGAEEFVIQLQVERLGEGYYRLYHNVYTD